MVTNLVMRPQAKDLLWIALVNISFNCTMIETLKKDQTLEKENLIQQIKSKVYRRIKMHLYR